MVTSADNIVGRYLGRLEHELRSVPAARRSEVMQEIAGHIAAAREELAAETDADVLNILDRVGDPIEIAADARDRFGVQERRSNWREVAAIILLPFGGVIIPVAGWFVGVFFLWVSDAWTRRDKLIGTLIVPGGLLSPLMLLTIAGISSGSSCSGNAGGRLTCTGGGGGSHVLLIVLLSALLAAPLSSALYLALRLRRRCETSGETA